MKRFKEFKSEQQYIAEVGPIGAAMMGAMGLWGAWKTFKKLKDTFKGYKESKAEKKENKKEGFSIRIKKFNPDTGKEEPEIVDIPPGDKRGNVDADGILKLEKEEQKKQDSQNKKDASAWKKQRDDLGMNDKEYVDHKAKEKKDKARADSGDVKTPAKDITLKYKKFDRDNGKLVDVSEPASKDMFDDEIVQLQKDKTAEAEKKLDDYKQANPDKFPDEPETTDDGETETGDGETETGDGEDETEKEPVTDPKQATQIYVDTGKAPDGWEYVVDPEGGKVPHKDNPTKKGQVLTNKDAKALKDKKRQEREREASRGGVRHKPNGKPKTKQTTTTTTTAPQGGGLKDLARQQGLSTGRILNFGEFITEDLMKDLKLASKSRKDSEITLDDGTDIPMDAFTAEILVKYIEGLSSSEKNKTIKQFQRTERAFMKVLGKAHEG